MARDLYGEMLSRALNRGAPQGHFAAYIEPGEAAQLRAQGGGVSPGGGQYVANGLPSYQSSPEMWFDPGSEEYESAEALGPMEQFATAGGGSGTLIPNIAHERGSGSAAYWGMGASTPGIRQNANYAAAMEIERAVGAGDLATAIGYAGADPSLGATEVRAKAVENAQSDNAAMAERRIAATDDMIEKNPWLTGEELDAAKIAVMQKYRQPVSNDELSALNLAHIESIQYGEDGKKLSLEARSDLLNRDISKGGLGRFSFGAGAYRRGVDRGFWDGVSDSDQMRWVRYLNQPGKDGGYAVTDPSGSVSMPKELMSFVPALVGSAASFLLPPAASAALTFGMSAGGGPGLTRWAEAKYGDDSPFSFENPLASILGKGGDPKEIDTASILPQPDLDQTVVDVPEIPDFPIAELPPATEPLVSPAVTETVTEDARPLDPISETIQRRLAENRRNALRQQQEALAGLLVSRQQQFA
jgi:hypothetical protein